MGRGTSPTSELANCTCNANCAVFNFLRSLETSKLHKLTNCVEHIICVYKNFYFNYVIIIGTCIIFPPVLAGTLHWRARLCQCQCRPPPAEPACLHPALSPGRGGGVGEGEGRVREGMEGYNMYSEYTSFLYIIDYQTGTSHSSVHV